jgi:hypothetical protein
MPGMAGSDITRASVWQGMPVALMARLRNPAGVYVTQASLASISYTLFDLGSDNPTPTVPTSSGSLTISSVIFDALQLDARWTIDTIGYDFLWLMPGALLVNAPTEYRMKVLFTGTDGNVYPAVYQLLTQPLF